MHTHFLTLSILFPESVLITEVWFLHGQSQLIGLPSYTISDFQLSSPSGLVNVYQI